MTDEWHRACSMGDSETVTRLLHAVPDVLNHEFEDCFAIQRPIPEHPDVLQILLKHGDDPNRLLKKVAWFVWEHAAIEKGLDFWRPIHQAALHGYHENSVRCVNILRDSGADLNYPSPLHGYSAIHLASLAGMVAVAGVLVDSGVTVDSESCPADRPIPWPELMDMRPFVPFGGSGVTPLMLACGEGHAEMVGKLLSLGADIHAQSAEGFTPLHFAAGAFWIDKQGQAAHIVQDLLEKGADPEARDSNGRRPREIAESKSYAVIVEILPHA